MQDKNPQYANGSAEICRKTEELAVRQEIHDLGGVPKDDMKALLHELEVHQVELELQNEELLRAKQELQASKDRYADLFAFAPVGYLTLDRHFQIVEANFVASQILDVDRRDLFCKRLTQFVMREYQDLFYQCIKADVRPKRDCELMMHRRDGARFYAELKIVEDAASGADVRYRVAVTDITERKRMEAELKRSRDELEVWVHERTCGSRNKRRTILRVRRLKFRFPSSWPASTRS